MRHQVAPFGVGEIGRIYAHATERTLLSSRASYFSDSFLTEFYEVRFRIRRHSKRHISLSAECDVLVTP